jgi:hypothetical protein
LQRADDAWVSKGKTRTNIAQYWSKWIKSHLKAMSTEAAGWASQCVGEVRGSWLPREDSPVRTLVLSSLVTLESQLGGITVNTANLD